MGSLTSLSGFPRTPLVGWIFQTVLDRECWATFTAGQTHEGEGRARVAQDIHVPLRSADMAHASVWPLWFPRA